MNKMYSDNIIFFDTEFTNLNIEKGELLSIGLVKNNGKKLYLEFKYEDKDVHPWVKKKVLPYLKGRKISLEKGREKIWDFVGRNNKEKPFLMAYVNQFDAMYWYKIFGDPQKHPAFWIPIDFASILFAYGYSPESPRYKKFYDELKIDNTKYQDHNALEDAKKLRDMYTAFIKKIKTN